MCSAVSVDVLSAPDVVAVCTPNCRQSLLDLRDKIDAVCQGSDLLNWREVNYPGVYTSCTRIHGKNTKKPLSSELRGGTVSVLLRYFML
jgi:hypothetical protein